VLEPQERGKAFSWHYTEEHGLNSPIRVETYLETMVVNLQGARRASVNYARYDRVLVSFKPLSGGRRPCRA
jgi:hypothetical protein